MAPTNPSCCEARHTIRRTKAGSVVVVEATDVVVTLVLFELVVPELAVVEFVIAAVVVVVPVFVVVATVVVDVVATVVVVVIAAHVPSASGSAQVWRKSLLQKPLPRPSAG